MKFVKMHGLGNDFVLCHQRELREISPGALSIALCDRHRGVGADGLLLYEIHDDGVPEMRLFNSDGSEAEMCGNGIRCLARFLCQQGMVKGDTFSITTKAGLMKVKVFPHGGSDFMVEVNMGAPRLTRKEIPVTGDGDSAFMEETVSASGKDYRATCVSMGNPHCIVFVDNLKDVDPASEGASIEHSPLFPSKTNVEFAKVRDRNTIEVKVWERGAGETLACGTGACATLAAGSLTGRTDRKAVVMLPGGSLQIEWREDGALYMKGPAVKVFEGDFDPGEILAGSLQPLNTSCA